MSSSGRGAIRPPCTSSRTPGWDTEFARPSFAPQGAARLLDRYGAARIAPPWRPNVLPRHAVSKGECPILRPEIRRAKGGGWRVLGDSIEQATGGLPVRTWRHCQDASGTHSRTLVVDRSVARRTPGRPFCRRRWHRRPLLRYTCGIWRSSFVPFPPGDSAEVAHAAPTNLRTLRCALIPSWQHDSHVSPPFARRSFLRRRAGPRHPIRPGSRA